MIENLITQLIPFLIGIVGSVTPVLVVLIPKLVKDKKTHILLGKVLEQKDDMDNLKKEIEEKLGKLTENPKQLYETLNLIKDEVSDKIKDLDDTLDYAKDAINRLVDQQADIVRKMIDTGEIIPPSIEEEFRRVKHYDENNK